MFLWLPPGKTTFKDLKILMILFGKKERKRVVPEARNLFRTRLFDLTYKDMPEVPNSNVEMF